jgi:4-oxalocrotonate tautomerase
MPLIEVKLYDFRVDEESTPKIVTALTDALVSVIGEPARDGTWVIVDSIPPQRWGIGGRVGTDAA